ncbi:hypothetical protein VNO80_20942 [Phaseolus coccineus]|uniref:Uncharacterized protein n=1 Tax=Phaseolus coccineus TaxID=3886 RepID=A0AAN9M6L3_PHACN
MISSNWQVDIWDWELVTGNTVGPTETIYQWRTDDIHHSRDRQIIMSFHTCHTLLLIKFPRNCWVLLFVVLLLNCRAARKHCELSEFSFTRST